MTILDAIRTTQLNHKQFYRVVFRNLEGGVSIMQVDPFCGETLEVAAIRSLAIMYPGVTDFALIHIDDLPNERDFRAAYALNNGKCVIDMEKAKEIHLDRLRAMREPLLKKSDVDLMRAIEDGEMDKARFLSSKRQALRDVTKTELSHVKTLGGLRKVIPPILTEEV